MSDLVSILIMVYNNKHFLKEAIDSVLIQTYKKIEIIISDDCSNNFDDSDIEYIKSYINKNKKDNIVRYIVSRNENNIGIIRNYNKCLIISSGEYIMYLSADDSFYDENVVSDIVKFFNDTSYDIVTCHINLEEEYNDENSQVANLKYQERDTLKNILNESRQFLCDNPSILYLRLCRGNFIPGACTYYKRDLLRKYGLYDEDYIHLEDWPRYLNLSRRNCIIGFYKRKTINYRIGGVTTGNVNTVSNDIQKNSIINIIHRDEQIAIEKEISPYIKDIINSLLNNKSYKSHTSNIDSVENKRYKISIYLKEKDDIFYNEEKSIQEEVNPNDVNIKKTIDLRDYKNLTQIRLDPLDCRCSIKIRNIYGIKDDKKKDLCFTCSNNHTKYQDIYFFSTKDPQIYINILGDLDYLFINYDFLSYENVFLDNNNL